MTPERVAEVSGRWLWYPPTARTVETDELLLVRFPDWFESPLALLRLCPERPTRTVLAEVLEHARTFDVPTLDCWVKLDAPTDLEDLLLRHGAEPRETLDVLAVELTGDRAHAEGADAAEVELRWQSDPETERDGQAVAAAVFGGEVGPEDDLAARAAEHRAGVPAGDGGSLVAYVDGVPVGTGGLSVDDGAARLWGGAVLPDQRRRGVYRALLTARLDYAEQHGLTMALVKGRVETSGPILRRAGFEAFGQERCYRLRL